MRSLALRVFAFVLAALPVVWGSCPRWIGGEGFECSLCASNASGHEDSAPRCPCCAAKTAARGPGHKPTRPQRSNDSCPVLEVRHTLTLAPADIAVPAVDLTAIAFESIPTVAAVSAPPALARRLLDPSGGSPPLVGTVILLI